MSEELREAIALLKEAADHIDGVTGARQRPNSDSGVLVALIDELLGRYEPL